MRFLVVLAHPVESSFAASLAATTVAALEQCGHEVDLLDLYKTDFDPRLTKAERENYLDPPYDASAVADLADRLRQAEGLVLVFPHWWFNMPAILKGYIDRVFVPGVAFEYNKSSMRLEPRLSRLKTILAVTTTGAPWWIVHLYMGNPVARILKRAVFDACAPKARFRMIALHNMDTASLERRVAFLKKVERALSRL